MMEEREVLWLVVLSDMMWRIIEIARPAARGRNIIRVSCIEVIPHPIYASPSNIIENVM
jgi:hypothetical protein